ncbi:DUF305 domain-containing protein [Glycomyces xiaoerkulensis]|uniref:DUF305 domain-containing protein n=1 Tax=Glycomyces xiaoerkulensis TaxID=2038139 RepID=UPI000C25A3FB|nr:DUF305 domain-containing protein [Glycomyces xiaoerkulensis]
MSLWRRPALLVAITAVLMLAAGFAVGWVAGGAAPGDDSPEAGFARDMQTHHQQAVEMGMYEWLNGEDDAMRAIAYDIATAQSAEIGMMRSWLTDWDVPMSSAEQMAWAGDEHVHDPEEDETMAGMATREQMAELKTLEGAEADMMFANLMIEHHIGGIEMAEAYLDVGDHPTVADAATRMVQVQRKEITDMEAHLSRIESEVEG